MAEIIIYCTKSCPYCTMAKNLLDGKELEYTSIDVGADSELWQEMEEKTKRNTVPQVFVGENHIGGFDDLSAADKSGELDKIIAKENEKMAEKSNGKTTDEKATDEETTQVFQTQKIYTQNISFESPNAPAIFLKEFKPELEVDLNIEAKALEDGVHHVMIRITATIKVEDTTAFLCEVEQAGIFAISGFDEANLQYLLAVQCPNTLFPFAREAISDLVTKGGFPQLLLEPVNFDAMFANHMQQAQKSTKQ